MIQTIINCDRCHKLLGQWEGVQYQLISRGSRPLYGVEQFLNAVTNVVQMPTAELPMAGELCEGCSRIFYFMLKDKFKEDGTVNAS